ncbi:CWF19-like protein 2 [Harpegnathos saltator]|uniref:CWF19-like protein 2 n=1 Tax=Harpegnathos saltator TaxID=610380 RepID=E2C3X8_HARSA|nr:CWF19-like protein 2 [Harpegnathos saltator]EFN77364.1 CWF19-like protein 2 [Harpegnathos saltator]
MYNNECIKTNHNEDSVPHLNKKSKKSKSKKRQATKKEKKKYKKKRKYSTSSSSSESSGSDTLEWVEKTNENQTSPYVIENPISKAQEKQSKRDEWMNIESFLPCTSKSEIAKQKSDTKEEDKTRIFLDKPGQSDRELNPYWKDGGNGLPQSSAGRFDNQSNLDANWLKKSFRRAKEQALRDGRSLEEVAAERWGSLETIQMMIAKAERISNSEQENSYHKKSHNDSNKSSWRASSSRRKNHSRSKSRSKSRSRSRSRERNRKHSTHYSSQSTRQKQMYHKPKENDDYYQLAAHISSSSRVKNWKKDKDDRKYESESSSSRLKETIPDRISDTKEVDKKENTDILSEAEMNKLGAKIIKAEIMGDEELATQFKEQLEQARKLAATNKAIVQKETVILTRIDAKGIERPIQPRSQYKQSTEGHRRKKITETHVSGERMRYFADDDKYSLQEMFQREKGRSADEDEAMFTKYASKSADYMDDMFEQQIARTNLEAKDDKRDRALAIREHKNLSKRLDNCWWCPDSKNMLKHMIVTVDSMICLSLPACDSLTTGHCILTPIQHITCQLQLDEDVWENLKELKGKLTTMFTNEDLYPIFFEVYKKRHRFSHMQLECIPLPKDIGESAPMYFKKALLECETEWSMNKKIIDLKNKNIRHAVPNGLSYFMIEFASHPGYAHVIEDEEMFPKNFAEEVIGGMLDLDCNLWRKPRKQSFDEQRVKVLEFTEMWKKCNILQG